MVSQGGARLASLALWGLATACGSGAPFSEGGAGGVLGTGGVQGFGGGLGGTSVGGASTGGAHASGGGLGGSTLETHVGGAGGAGNTGGDDAGAGAGTANGGAWNGGASSGGVSNGGALNGGASNGGALNGGASNGGATNLGGKLNAGGTSGAGAGGALTKGGASNGGSAAGGAAQGGAGQGGAVNGGSPSGGALQGGTSSGGAAQGGTSGGGAAQGGKASGGSASGGATQTTCGVFVNEVQVASSASSADEFVEIYNSCATQLALSGHRLVYRAMAGVNDVLLFAFAASDAIGPKSFLVFGGSGYTGPVAGTFPGGSTGVLSAQAGGIGLRGANDMLIDSLGYGNATNAFVEGTASVVPNAGMSIGRLPDGADTNDNFRDFTAMTSTPAAANH